MLGGAVELGRGIQLLRLSTEATALTYCSTGFMANEFRCDAGIASITGYFFKPKRNGGPNFGQPFNCYAANSPSEVFPSAGDKLPATAGDAGDGALGGNSYEWTPIR